MSIKLVGEDKIGVSPVIAVILMVAITVVLAGVVYVWIQSISSPDNPGLAYVSAKVEGVNGNDWDVLIQKVEGENLHLNTLSFIINSGQGYTMYEKSLSDVNPDPFYIQNTKVYPIAANISISVTSKQTSQPITNKDKINDYIGAIFTIMDTDNDSFLSPGDVIRIYNDFDNDGTPEIVHGDYFRLKSLSGSHQYLEKFL